MRDGVIRQVPDMVAELTVKGCTVLPGKEKAEMDEPLSDEAMTENPQGDEGVESESGVSPAKRAAPRRGRPKGSSVSTVRAAAEAETDELLTVACTPGLSHGSFRLYVILAAVARKRGSRGKFFPVTLNGLQRVHPGTAGKEAGVTTIFKQINELKMEGLLHMRATLYRSEPDLPVLVKVLYPKASNAGAGSKTSQLTWEATDGSRLTASDVGRVIEMQ
jgi:hypothetical protein